MEIKRQPKKTKKTPVSPPKSQSSSTVGHVLSGRARPSAHPRSVSHAPKKTSVIFSKKTLFALGFLIGLALLLFIIFRINHHTAEQSNQNSGEHSNKQPSLAPVAPPFTAALPSGKSIESLGGWQRVSPNENDPTYAYIDTIGSASITVSQQPLPKNFATNTDSHVAELAKKFSASNQLEINSVKVYIGTSAKGPQSVIFATDSLLILIKSHKTIDDAAWTSYIRSLL